MAKQDRSGDKITLKELDESYPTGVRQKPNRRAVATARYKRQLLGKMGAASPVRQIDPATVDLSKYGVWI